MFFFFFFQAEDGIRDYKVTGVQTCALPISGSAGAVHDRFGERQSLFAVVRAFFAGIVDQTAPAVANADDLIAVAQCANRDGTDGGIETGNVAAPGEDADGAFAHGAENRAALPLNQ